MYNKTIEIKEKALQIIEFLIQDLDLTLYPKDNGELRSSLDKIYRIAHAASDTSCQHIEWENELELTHSLLKKYNAF